LACAAAPRALLRPAETIARALGCHELFTSTSIVGGLLRRNGWQEKDDVQFLNGERGKVDMRTLTSGRQP
jgi:hypothetical protein